MRFGEISWCNMREAGWISVAVDSPETKLLLRCATTSKDAETASRITALLRENLDWSTVLELALRHRVTPLLHWHLSVENSDAVPNHVLEVLRARFRDNNLRNLRLTGELLKVTRAFETNGIPVIPYKGPVLAALGYKNLALREFLDLDVLVHKQDVWRARELLATMGYQEQDRWSVAEEAAFLETQREYRFWREDGTVVELHWAVMPKIHTFQLDPESPWDRIEESTLGGATVSTFSSEDMLLFLCVHGSKHFWHRLAWICDVAELIRANRVINWDQLTERASQSGARRMLFLGLFLAADLLGAALPRTIRERIQADTKVKPLARQVRGWLFQEANEIQLAEASSFHPFRVRIRERYRDKVLYLTRTALTPTPEDWELLPLPKPLFPLYYVLRPIRLGGRYGQGLLSRIRQAN